MPQVGVFLSKLPQAQKKDIEEKSKAFLENYP
jgi:hypothetical protein